jgi:MFS family permease
VESPDAVVRANLRAATAQAIWWGVMFGAGEASFALFAGHLQAPAWFFGVLTGVPNLLGPIAQSVAAGRLDATGKRLPLILSGVLVQAVSLTPLALAALLDAHTVALAVSLAAIMLYYVAGAAAVPPWSSLIADIVPAKTRGRTFARLSQIPTLVSLVGQLAVGAGLGMAVGNAETDAVYAVAFALAATARLASAYVLNQIAEPALPPAREPPFSFWQFISRRESNFRRFVIFTACLHGGANVAAPYFLPYALYDLSWEPWRWVVLGAVGALASVASLSHWGKLADRLGNKRVLALASVSIAVIPPLGWLSTRDYVLLVLINALGSVLWAGFNLASFNYIIEAVTPARRARCVAYFNVTVGIGVLGGSLVGAGLLSLAQHVVSGPSFLAVLVVSSALRLTACVLLAGFRELTRDVPRPSEVGLFAPTIRAMYGIRFTDWVKQADEETLERESGVPRTQDGIWTDPGPEPRR